MKAIQILGSQDDHNVILSNSLPRPIPTGNQVLIKVHAAGITADEIIWPELYASPNRVPGHDISGTVESLGSQYEGPLSLGQNVYAMIDAEAPQGGQAEYVIAMPNEIAIKPSSISHAEAAAIPIPALTAWEALFKRTNLDHGSKILVTGASGAVGVMFVQIAKKLLSAEVIALASTSSNTMLAELGANQVVDYNNLNWHQGIHDVDAVFDTVGGEILTKTWSTVKKSGIVVTVADPAPKWAFGRGQPEELQDHPEVRWLHFILSPDGDTLSRVASLIDDGTLKPIPVVAFEAERAIEAWKFAAQRGRKGKAVLEFVAEK
ncbi:uncharacterized protein TRIVIDRAFT_50895 [Trichoderma virens Gv29-8]|uniref:Enoyl reductase (ER) domain-containing protein n=1 Tax=Hypocrea virens (strain Gv29-8 / FGSC 10586) TaxID=413071 RepID=G9N4V9_HYPVG|nr:uncharacterized protein TRIVIDRAFT_50895 [Trichoderma virens Gv29-8]EHK18633.1 hypothetical protein TRIVIDRAFT_50895 [Trichoderma virens Gv29-8]UKZ52835.1 putative secondary metabolism biosynthetic enzyme [Trichoderma virens]